MSGSLLQTAGGTIASVLLRPQRAFGSIIPNVVVEEGHEDDLAITQHPIEQGANVTDHAFSLQPTVTIRAAWTNSASTGAAVLGALASFNSGGEGYSKQVYDKLLALQKSRQPFKVVTGKRSYENMLMERLSSVTDKTTEYALFITATFRQITIVQVVTAMLAPQENHTMPQQTGPTQNSGPAIPQKTESGLHILTNGVMRILQ